MPMEAPRCIDCGTPLKSVPSWLATAKVSFTCGSCPRRSSRPAVAAVARFDKPIEAKSSLADDPEIDAEDMDEVDEEADLDAAADESDDIKDDDL